MLGRFGLNGRQENAAWFILLAAFDIGTFLLATWHTPYLADYEANLLYRAYGMLPTLLFYVIAHAAVLYYLFNPVFRGRDINFSFASLFFLICFVHLIGGISNIMSWNTAMSGGITADDTPPTTDDNIPILLTMLFIIWLMGMAASYSFSVYSSMADEQPTGKFPNVSLKTEAWAKIKRTFKRRGL